ncbi:MAG: hypothetical protein HQL30_10035 [Candidatus Omnitrophica bacterium]|nr:hypothetical protein [Candidatus Omnitrophota bacterium]
MKTRITALALSLVLFFQGESRALTPEERQAIEYEIQVSDKLSEFLSDLFDKFSEGYVEPDEALKKLSVYRNEFDLSVNPPQKDGERLFELMHQFLSYIENYFIYFKRTQRENPEINIEIYKLKVDIKKEVIRLNHLL